MNRKVVSGMMFILLFIGMLTWTLNIQPVRASGTIYIRPDGTIDPPTALIQRDGDLYTFTDNIYDKIVVQRDNIVVDGAGYTVQGTGSGKGISLTERSNVTIKNMEIKAFEHGIWLYSSSYSKISANNITNNDPHGISLFYSSNNTISGNNISENYFFGIVLDSSSNTSMAGNNITNNLYGIRLFWSSNSMLRNNDASNNKWNFGVHGSSLSHYIQDIDDSNTVNGQPVYYWVNRRDLAVPLDAGYVALVNCTNMTVKNLNLTNNGQGVLLAFTTNSTITKNNVTNNDGGIRFRYSSNNIISENNITINYYGIVLDYSSNNSISGNNISGIHFYGIRLDGSSNNTISGNNISETYFYGIVLYLSSNTSIVGNNITNNLYGIILEYYSSNNTISGNNISENTYGIGLSRSSDNLIYHNNFEDNTEQVHNFDSTNDWDDGYPSGGNYWSDYEERYPDAKELDDSGIWDTPYATDENNQDNYPLMKPWSPKPPSPKEAIEELVQTVESLHLGAGIETSLTSKLQAAHRSLNRENQNAAIGQLTAFLNEVEALRNKKLTDKQANQLATEAQRIIDLTKGE